MKVFKNLFGDGSKINASEVAIKNKGEIDTLEEISDRSLLQYSSLTKVKQFIPNIYMGRYHSIQLEGGSLNDVNYSGLYYVVASEVNNTPSSTNGYLLVISAHAGHCVQMYTATTLTNSTLYIRKCTSGTNWGSWMTIG